MTTRCTGSCPHAVSRESATDVSASFEDRITLGLAQWITLVETDEAAQSLRIGLTHNPEDSATERSLYFTAVTKVVSEWHDPEEGCMETIIGAHEDKYGQQLQYLLHTDQRELLICADQPVVIPGQAGDGMSDLPPGSNLKSRLRSATRRFWAFAGRIIGR